MHKSDLPGPISRANYSQHGLPNDSISEGTRAPKVRSPNLSDALVGGLEKGGDKPIELCSRVINLWRYADPAHLVAKDRRRVNLTHLEQPLGEFSRVDPDNLNRGDR